MRAHGELAGLDEPEAEQIVWNLSGDLWVMLRHGNLDLRGRVAAVEATSGLFEGYCFRNEDSDACFYFWDGVVGRTPDHLEPPVMDSEVLEAIVAALDRQLSMPRSSQQLASLHGIAYLTEAIRRPLLERHFRSGTLAPQSAVVAARLLAGVRPMMAFL